ncbi:Vmc-like lipoprotein signal peptide domain-containing protein [Streptomyces sp. NPDC059017]
MMRTRGPATARRMLTALAAAALAAAVAVCCRPRT